MGDIIPFLPKTVVFDDVTTRVMGEAFDAACDSLHDTGQPHLVREVIAQRVILAAQRGERDPARLRDIGLAALGLDRRP